MKPRQPPRTVRSEGRCQFQQVEEPGRCEWKSDRTSAPQQAEVFSLAKESRRRIGWHRERSKCKECGHDLPARGALRLRELLRAARGRLRPLRRSTRRRRSARSRPARRGSGATPTSCRSPGRPGDPLEPGLTPLLRADRLAERLGLDAEVWIKNDAANPTHSFKDRVVAVALAKAQELGFETVACASTGNLANAVAAHAAAAGLDSYVFVPADLEEQKLLATGVYGTNLVGVHGNYDDVNRLCTELAETRPWAFVNVNLRPYYAEGSKTLAYETVEQLGWELPDRVVCPIASGSLFTKIGRGFQEWLDLGLVEGELAGLQRRPGARAAARSPTAFAEGWDVCKPQSPDTIAKSLAIGDPADGPYALELARRTGGGDRLGHRRRDPRRDPPAGRDDRDLHRDRRRRHRRRAARSSPSAARSTPASASSSTSPARA